MKHIEPYNDERLIYNKQSGRYEISMEYIKQTYTNPFADDNMLAIRLKKNTRKVYNYIFSISYSGNARIINAIIEHTEEYRKWIGDCLEAQIEADMASGYNDISLFASKSVEERALKNMEAVNIDCERTVHNANAYGGINLISATTFPQFVYLEFMGYCR